MEFHPLNSFPLMKEKELSSLARSIRRNGLHNAITLFEGKILDGRCRWKACQLAGVEPRFTEYTGDDPGGFVLSMNAVRAHYSPDQRAMIVARILHLAPEYRTGEWADFVRRLSGEDPQLCLFPTDGAQEVPDE